MDSIANTTKRFKWNIIILSIGYLGLGLLLIFLQVQVKQWICYILGGFSVVLGLVRIASFFARDTSDRILHSDLATGIVFIATGVFLFTNPTFIWTLLPIIIGFSILFDSTVKFQNSLAMRQMHFNLWWVVSLVSFVTAVLGILLIIGVFDDTILIYYLGGVLIADGIVNILVVIILSLVASRFKHSIKKVVKQNKQSGGYTEVYLAGEKPEKTSSDSPKTPTVPSGAAPTAPTATPTRYTLC